MQARLALILMLALAGCVVPPKPPTAQERLLELQATMQMLQTMRAAQAPAPQPAAATGAIPPQPDPDSERRLSVLETLVRELHGQYLELRRLIHDLGTRKE